MSHPVEPGTPTSTGTGPADTWVEQPGEPAATSGDWRVRLRRSRFGSTGVLLVVLALVLGGAWFMQRGKDATEQRVTNSGSSSQVTLEGDQSGPAPVVGQPAPGFTATTMDGRKVSLASMKGHPVWITFGATWCTACRAEAPDIQQIWKEKKPAGVQVLAVFISEDAATVQTYRNRLGLDFPMVSDPDTTLASRYRSIGIPSHFFIDADGILRVSRVGGLTPEMMRENLAAIGA